ncbi:MAG: 4-(cytidine 5'-diphospho)-2-C-methyl-D-erythritol kinase, partial [Thermoguttaceae bacterium]|nr:4-(cytidine 5'-diphospho)-2-C-methyl-D-erythritol kinase [Thermoguttaceae bacterium]
MKITAIENGARVLAPAKINLFFEILFKRDDGFHEIETLATPISLYDVLEIQFAKKGDSTNLVCLDESGAVNAPLPTDERNLVWRAAEAFFAEIGEKWPLSMKIFKKIPEKAGLGGGSSDAAAALAVLNKLYGYPVRPERLRAIGGELGSDVPLFLTSGASLGRGRGEIVESFAFPEVWLAVIKPFEGLATPAVFRRYAELPPTSKRSLSEYAAALIEN